MEKSLSDQSPLDGEQTTKDVGRNATCDRQELPIHHLTNRVEMSRREREKIDLQKIQLIFISCLFICPHCSRQGSSCDNKRSRWKESSNSNFYDWSTYGWGRTDVVTVINIQFLQNVFQMTTQKKHFLPSSEPIKLKPSQIHLLIQFHPIKFFPSLASLFCHETISRKGRRYRLLEVKFFSPFLLGFGRSVSLFYYPYG